MPEYQINVNEVEDLQMINNTTGLDQIFTRAKSMVNQGGTVVLARKYPDGRIENFDELTTESALEAYRQRVYKYL